MRTQIPGHLYYENDKLAKIVLPQDGLLMPGWERNEDRYIQLNELEKLEPYFSLPDKMIKGSFSIFKDGHYKCEGHILNKNEDGTLNVKEIEETYI